MNFLATLLRHFILAALALFVLTPLSATAQENPVGPIKPASPPDPARPIPPIVQSWQDAWNAGDAQTMSALFTEDGVYQDYAFQAQVEGKEGVEFWVELTVQNIPDTKVEIIDTFQTDGLIAVRWIFSGTPLRLGPVEGTGKSFSVPAVSIFELKGDRIVSVGDYYNRADVLGQLGLFDTFARP